MNKKKARSRTPAPLFHGEMDQCSVATKLQRSLHNVKFYCWEILFNLLPERKLETMKIIHFSSKIFISSKILEEFLTLLGRGG